VFERHDIELIRFEARLPQRASSFARVGPRRRSLRPAKPEGLRGLLQAGYFVLLRAKRINIPSGPQLEVRATLAADVLNWLALPVEHRGHTFVEFDWIRTDYRIFSQHPLPAVMGAEDSRITQCAFTTARARRTRTTTFRRTQACGLHRVKAPSPTCASTESMSANYARDANCTPTS
jgi:hypothetical protein